MSEYKGTFLGFRYETIKTNVAEFRTWLKQKIQRYVLPSDCQAVLEDILGITDMKAEIESLTQRVAALEKK